MEDVDRDSYGARLVGDSPRERLPDPPGGVRREVDSAIDVVAVHGGDQSEIPFLDEVEEFDAAISIGARLGHDEAEVREDETLPGFLDAAPHRGPEGVLRLPLEDGISLDLVQVAALEIADAPRRLLWSRDLGRSRALRQRDSLPPRLGDEEIERGRVEVRRMEEAVERRLIERAVLQPLTHRVGEVGYEAARSHMHQSSRKVRITNSRAP